MAEEPCQCSDCQRFYKEHDRLIREFPTFKQQQELNWASIQSFRTLCNKVTEQLQRQLTERETNLIIFINDKKNVTVKELQKTVWDYSPDLDTHTVETHIYRLRKKMKETFGNESFILNTSNGYSID